MSGVAGNKGAVAIRFEYANTRLCFVTAHLAAGFSNTDERNRDYETIANGLRFQQGRKIEDHDSIIWLGDFNYRIGLPDDRVRELIELGDLQTLHDNDQASSGSSQFQNSAANFRLAAASSNGSRAHISILYRGASYI